LPVTQYSGGSGDYSATNQISAIQTWVRNLESGQRYRTNVQLQKLQKLTKELPRLSRLEAEVMEAITHLVTIEGGTTIKRLAEQMHLSEEMIESLCYRLKFFVEAGDVWLPPNHPLAGGA